MQCKIQWSKCQEQNCCLFSHFTFCSSYRVLTITKREMHCYTVLMTVILLLGMAHCHEKNHQHHYGLHHHHHHHGQLRQENSLIFKSHGKSCHSSYELRVKQYFFLSKKTDVFYQKTLQFSYLYPCPMGNLVIQAKN